MSVKREPSDTNDINKEMKKPGIKEEGSCHFETIEPKILEQICSNLETKEIKNLLLTSKRFVIISIDFMVTSVIFNLSV
jgi:hypothetical protein